MISLTVYKNRNNPISLQLKAGGIYQDIRDLSRVTLEFGKQVIDSRTSASTFDWTTNGEDGQLDITLTLTNELKRGSYRSRLTVYDATYPQGLVWGDILINVEDVCPTG